MRSKVLNPEILGERGQALKEFLERRVLGQPEAIESVIRVMTPYFGGLNDGDRPIATLLFLGGTGTGKTLIAESLAEFLCGTKKALTRVNCEAYSHGHEVTKLTGSPPSYVGSDTPALLSNRKMNEWNTELLHGEAGAPQLGVILFDEIEKAAPELFRLLLGIFDSGKLSLGNNTVADFSQSVIILTSNLGGKAIEKILNDAGMGFAPQVENDISSVAVREAKKHFPPEFYNRLDDVVTFRPLTEDIAKGIVELEVGKVQKKAFACSHPFMFVVRRGAIAQLVREGFSNVYGGREIRRTVARRVTEPLACLLASGQVKERMVVKIDFSEGWTFTAHPDLLPPLGASPKPSSKPVAKPDAKPDDDPLLLPPFPWGL